MIQAPGNRQAARGPALSTAWLEHNPQPELGVRAQSAVLVDLDSRQVLWQLAPHARRAPASLTKMVTAMVAVDLAPMDLEVVVPRAAAEVEPDVMGLTPGEVVSVRTLLYGLFLDSGNDAAETLSRTILPRERFLALMNERAAALGMADSTFSNPSGLDDPAQRSSAHDLALAASAIATGYPALLQIAGTRESRIPASPSHKAFEPYNLNKLLWTYSGATGMKTGFTDDAGGCVAVTATRGSRHLAVVVLGSPLFFTDAARLLDLGFSLRV